MVFPGLSEQDWLYGIFLFSAVVVFGNGIHYVVFRLLRRQQSETGRRGLGLQKYLAWPARAVFLSIGLLIVLPFTPRLSPQWLDRIEEIVRPDEDDQKPVQQWNKNCF